FPRMDAGVRTDELLLPVNAWPLVVMLLESLVVVLPLVAEPLTKVVDERAVLDQSVPIVVADLVTEMTQDSAVRFVEPEPPPLAFHLIRLGHIQRDHPVIMPGEYRRCSVSLGICQELKSEATFGLLKLALDRTSQSQQGVHQAPLRHLELVPGLLVPRPAQVRDHTRQATRLAERVRVVIADDPVTDVVLRVVVAEAIEPSFRPGQGRA